MRAIKLTDGRITVGGYCFMGPIGGEVPIPPELESEVSKAELFFRIIEEPVEEKEPKPVENIEPEKPKRTRRQK